MLYYIILVKFCLKLFQKDAFTVILTSLKLKNALSPITEIGFKDFGCKVKGSAI